MAHEIAVQLQAAGEQVAALVMLDAYPAEQDADPAAVGEASRNAGEADRSDDPESSSTSDENDVRAQRLRELRADMGAVLGGISDEELIRIMRVFENNSQLLVEHRTGRFRGDALMVVAAQGKATDVPLAQRWEPYISEEITEVSLPLTHADMMRPHTLGQVWAAVEGGWARAGRSGASPNRNPEPPQAGATHRRVEKWGRLRPERWGHFKPPTPHNPAPPNRAR